MARVARVVLPGYPYHVTHRGNRREDVFFSSADRDVYREWLGEYARQYKLEIWAYCLMTNHVHLLVVPKTADSLAYALGRAHMRYARYANRQQGWSGHLWANRFYSTVLDEDYLWTAVHYIETNPVRAGLVTQAEAYPWSSARAHCCLAKDTLLSPRRPFPDEEGEWSAWLAAGTDDDQAKRLRACTYTGRPCGSERFITRLERRLGRPLRPQKRGRKPKDHRKE
jgi:putative transposase